MADAERDTAVMLGEVRGQLRELIHQGNNTSMKIDALAREVAVNSTLPGIVADIAARTTVLEKQEHRRDGALGLGEWLMRSNLVVYVLMIAGVAWAAITGKLSH